MVDTGKKLSIDRRVRVRPQTDCGAHGHLWAEDGATGLVVAVDDTPQAPPDEPWDGPGPDPADALRGHCYRVRFDTPLLDVVLSAAYGREILISEEHYRPDELEPLPVAAADTARRSARRRGQQGQNGRTHRLHR